MCILLKFHYEKFGVSSLFFFQKLSKKNLLGVGSTPLGKGRVKQEEAVKKAKKPTGKLSFK